MKRFRVKSLLALIVLLSLPAMLSAAENPVGVVPDLVRYVEIEGSYTFEEKEYTAVDALVFARLSYEPFQLLPEKADGYTISQAAEFLLDFPLFSEIVLIEWDDELLEACASSLRYRDVEILEFTYDTDDSIDKQFSAVTFRLPDGLLFVAFRGTDNTLVGWKEDFNMSFSAAVPSQIEAVSYLEKVASSYDGTLILTGHSKGGNIAKYAASFVSEAIQDRIREVWVYDAPGFPDSVLESEGYKRVRDRMKVFVPESSVIGMLLSNDLEYISVKSNAFTGLSQHDVYTWEIAPDGNFVVVDGVDSQSRYVDVTIRSQLAAMPEEERRELVDLLFSLFETTGKTTFRSIREDFIPSVFKIVESYTELDDSNKDIIKENVSSFVGRALKNIGVLFSGDEK